MWSQPYLFLVLCFGAYYYGRTRRAFAENLHRPTFGTFFIEQCDHTLRRGIVRGLLLGVPDQVNAINWLILVAMLRQGGAGCLFWYALFSLLWIKPMGALAALWNYYRDPEDSHINLGKLLGRIRVRKGLEPGPRRCALLRLAQLALLGCLLHPVSMVLVGAGSALSWAQAAIYLPVVLVLWLVCHLLGERAWVACSALFLLFLAVALAVNLSNLIPTLALVVRDAFQVNRFLFALSGAGLAQAIRSGAQLGTVSFMLQGMSRGRVGVLFEHPIHCAICAELRTVIHLVLQLLLGLLYLFVQIVPQENLWVQLLLRGFLCLFGAEFFARNFSALRQIPSRSTAVVVACMAALLVIGCWPGMGLFAGVLDVVIWGCSLCLVALLLYDSNWYFALLENYRDAYLWRVEPYPRISTKYTKK